MQLKKKIERSYEVIQSSLGLAQKLSRNTMDFVQNATCSIAKMPYRKVLEELKPFRLKKKTRLYRGLYWEDFNSYKEHPYRKSPIHPKVGDQFVYSNSYGNASSWTTDLTLAKKIAQEGALGMVISSEMTPEQSIFITAKIRPLGCDYGDNEGEVVCTSGPFQVSIVYLNWDPKVLASSTSL